MASKNELPNIIDTYDYNKHLDMSSLAAGLFNRAALSDTKEESKPEEKRGRRMSEVRTDCIFYDGCHLPTRLCDDDCYRYDTEGKHPLKDDDQPDYLRDMDIEMGVEE